MAAFDMAALERRVAALEKAAPASLRFGRVVSTQGGTCRVELPDGQGMVSNPLPTLQRRVLRDQEIKLPDVGEPVAVLFSGQGCEAGVVLGAYYNPQEQDPGMAAAEDFSRYADGTVLHYDREGHKAEIVMPTGTVHCRVDAADITVQPDKIRMELGATVTVTEQAIELKLGAACITVTGRSVHVEAPEIELAGQLTHTGTSGAAGSGTLKGTYHVVEGDMDVQGVSVRTHTHSGVETGGGTTGAPVGGA